MKDELKDFREPEPFCEQIYDSLTVKITTLGKARPDKKGGHPYFTKKEVFCGDILVYSEMIPTIYTVQNFGFIDKDYFVNLCRSINQGIFRIDATKTQLPKMPHDVTYADVQIIVSEQLNHLYKNLDKLADKFINPPKNVTQ